MFTWVLFLIPGVLVVIPGVLVVIPRNKSTHIWKTNQNETNLSLKSDQKDPDLDLSIGSDLKLSLPYGSYSLTAVAPKYKRKKIKFDIKNE